VDCIEVNVQPYYEDSAVTIYHGSCLDILPQLADKSVDHVITDPPYSEQTKAGARSHPHKRWIKDPRLVPFAIDSTALRAIFGRCAQVGKRWLIASVDWMHAADLAAQPPTGLRFVRCGVWVKNNGAPQFTGDRPAQSWEAIAIMHVEGVRLRWNGGGRRGVWITDVEKRGVTHEHAHPTIKPHALIVDWVTLFTDSGDLILDPFMGSGTTLRAAKDCGRRAIGIEINERHCETAAKRMRQEVLCA
jgi:site-specific DNA-methyltransferase (adenine-specific)